MEFLGKRLIVLWYLIHFHSPSINNEIIMFFLKSVNKLVPKFATRFIKGNQTCCVAAVESVNLVKPSCEHISKSLPCPFHCSHTADNTFACDAFLCDVKRAASGRRGTAQDVCERDGARDNKEKQSTDHSYGGTKIKRHFRGERKARF